MNKKWMIFVLSLGTFWGLFNSSALAASGEESMIGAEVVGRDGYSRIGKIVGVARSEIGGAPQMYVVSASGIFGGRGVIPLSHVLDEVAVPEKDGSVSYRVEVSVNKATFRNIANWNPRSESVSAYLARTGSVLGIIYDLDQSTLDSFARNLVVDFGDERYSESEVANM